MSEFVEEDDFSRKVYCVLGIPVDDISLIELVGRVFLAAAARKRLFISTPNLNFLVLAQNNLEFRRSLVESDLCPPDGIGVLFACRLLAVPVVARVSGSDLPAAIQDTTVGTGQAPLRIALFGGAPGIGELARAAINASKPERLVCVTAIDPGIMTEDRIGDPRHVRRINESGADFLLVSLSAQNGQAWLMKNLAALEVPVASHLGATMNFLAGTIARAPILFRKCGLEWLWRISQEPRLASRYLSDGVRFFWILLTRIIPLGLWLHRNRRTWGEEPLVVSVNSEQERHCQIAIGGSARDNKLAAVADAFRNAVRTGSVVSIDLRHLRFFEMGFAGQVLMLEKFAIRHALSISIIGASSSVARALKLCGLGHLVVAPKAVQVPQL